MVSDQHRLEGLKTALAGRYQIEREIGSGGMATVYLAEDLKHNRKVAIKVLKPELAAVLGAERFVQEIQTTAQLQHPHILPLFDSGSADGFLYYVMPYVEGESLSAKLDREKQLPVDDAVGIANSVASALDYAQRHGVIHRDIKPANILLHDGQPMVADFGIALAVRAAGGPRLTETGLSLGTPQYMSPEQASGDREVDGRSDIYSLGCVLYEMLTGQPPHTGPTVQAVIAKLLTDRPRPVTELRETVPSHVGTVVQRALAKLPADRFTRARDFADALRDPGLRHRPREETAAPELSPRPTHTRDALALALLISVLVGAWGWLRPRPPPQVVRLPVAIPMTPGEATSQRFALSPNGDRLAYIAPTGDDPDGLWYRDLGVLQGTSMDVSDRVEGLTFSPDGSRIAFSTESGGLFIVAIKDGVPVRVAALPEKANSRFLEWGDDERIYAEGPDGLVAMRASGGTAWEPITRRAQGETRHLYPHALPNGRGLLFVIHGAGDPSSSQIGVVDLATGQHHALMPGVRAVFSSKTGNLVYVTADGGLSCVPFDEDRLTVTGRPRVLTGGVMIDQYGLSAEISLARNGTLLYVGSAGVDGAAQLVWVDRDGTESPLDSTWVEPFRTVALAPLGDRVAVSIAEGNEEHVWLRSVRGGPVQRLSSAGSRNWRPTWRGDGRSVAYISDRMGALRAFQRPADFSGPDEELFSSMDGVEEVEWLPDGQGVVFRRGGGISGGTRDIFTAPVGASQGESVAATGADERTPSLSPDGKWLVYRSDTSILVRSFRGVGAIWTLATGDVSEPLWSPTGHEIFYRDVDRGMVAVSVETEPTFSVIKSRSLFDTTPYRFESNHRAYDVTRDGQRFLMIRAHPSAAQLVWVQNFSEELKTLAPTGG